ncbi:hypothetical protein A2U01_0013479, partial [Trifolium medium]|nr:hypothetical protein [Trifolium medium]
MKGLTYHKNCPKFGGQPAKAERTKHPARVMSGTLDIFVGLNDLMWTALGA